MTAKEFLSSDQSSLKKGPIVHTCRICKKSFVCQGNACDFSEMLDAHIDCIEESNDKQDISKTEKLNSLF